MGIRLRSATLTSGTPVARRARLMSEMVRASPRGRCTRGSLVRASHERLHLRGDDRRRLGRGLRRKHASGFDRGHDDTGDSRHGVGGGKPVERFDERLQRAIRWQIERAERPGDHELEPAGHPEFTAALVVGEKRVEELRDADDRPSTRGNGAFYGHAAVAGKTHDVRRGHASDLAAHHLKRDLAGDGHGFIGPQSNPGCRKLSQGNWSIGSGHRNPELRQPCHRERPSSDPQKAVRFRKDASRWRLTAERRRGQRVYEITQPLDTRKSADGQFVGRQVPPTRTSGLADRRIRQHAGYRFTATEIKRRKRTGWPS